MNRDRVWALLRYALHPRFLVIADVAGGFWHKELFLAPFA